MGSLWALHCRVGEISKEMLKNKVLSGEDTKALKFTRL